MVDERISEVKNKKQFSKLPDSVVSRALGLCAGDVKKTRALLRKYFGVFLTNKVLKGKLSPEEMLGLHLSTRKRDYSVLYERILQGDVESVIDLGCGVNGFSYKFLPKGINYLGVEAVGQLVDNLNRYFKDRGFENAHVMQRDLFDLDFILNILKQMPGPRVVFMFQVVDALESFEKDFSKKFLLGISGVLDAGDRVVLSFPLKSLSGKTRFEVSRRWLLDFLKEGFEILEDFVLFEERFIVFKNR